MIGGNNFFSSILTSSNCCSPDLLIKLAQAPGGWGTHVNPSSNILFISLSTTSMQQSSFNHCIRNCNKGEPIINQQHLESKIEVQNRYAFFYLQTFFNVVWCSELRLLIVDYMPVKTIETNFMSQKHFSVFFYYSGNPINNEIEKK